MASPAATGAASAPPHRDQVVVAVTPALLDDGLADLRWLLHDASTAGACTLVVDVARLP